METNQIGLWVKKFRILTLALIFSGALNIGLLAAFIFFVLQERQTSLLVSAPSRSQGKPETTNVRLLSSMEHLSFKELISFLTNRDLVEEGYSKRDLALASLVAFYDFNLEKALSSPIAQKRTLSLSETQSIEIFPGLTDDQFQAIIRYAYQEKWPLTAKGLFSVLQKWGGPARDESLQQAFFVTPEFYSLQVLFQKTDAPQDATTLLNLACEGNWDVLERFSQEQSQILDLSVEKRRRLLLSYLSLQSPTAAQLLLRTDFLFALKRFEDKGILDLLSLLKNKTEESERFCVELLRSQRSDAVWQAAAMRLYSYVGETLSSPLDPKTALARFLPNQSAQTSVLPPSIPKPVPTHETALLPKRADSPTPLHVVKDGESLWKIARQYKVKVDELVRVNEIEKDRLYPGMTLRIPIQGTGSEPPQ